MFHYLTFNRLNLCEAVDNVVNVHTNSHVFQDRHDFQVISNVLSNQCE